MARADQAAEVEHAQLGHELIGRWAGLFRALSLYDWRHSAAVAAADRVLAVVTKLGSESPVDITLRGDSVYVDGARLRVGGSQAATTERVASLLRTADVRSVAIEPEAEPADLQVFAHLVIEICEGRATADRLLSELRAHGASSLDVRVAADSQDDEPSLLEGRELQKRVYVSSIGVLKSVFHEARSRDRINSRRVKRVVQQMMESLDEDSGYALNLTSVKNYDEYTFNHSVNVGVLAIALGRTVGLSRRHLHVLGQAGMLHDLGKLCIGRDLLNKPGRLTPEEREHVQRHPSEGFLSIATKQGVTPDTIGVALGAYEHHLNLDGTGYPEAAVPRPVSFLSRIVAIVDRYDAMTSARVYRARPMTPHKALSILYHSQGDQIDQALCRSFMNMLGAFPLGTVVRLTDDSVAIVVGPGSVAELLHFPTVRLVFDPDGQPAPDEVLDLSTHAKEPHCLGVEEVVHAEDYGIEVMDYIL